MKSLVIYHDMYALCSSNFFFVVVSFSIYSSCHISICISNSGAQYYAENVKGLLNENDEYNLKIDYNRNEIEILENIFIEWRLCLNCICGACADEERERGNESRLCELSNGIWSRTMAHVFNMHECSNIPHNYR